jgi:hypothetical protein
VKLYDDYEKKMNEAVLSFEEKLDKNSFWNYDDSIVGDVSSEIKEAATKVEIEIPNGSNIEDINSKLNEILKLLKT